MTIDEPRSVFLTAAELQALTGYRKPALQRRWLLENGYRFEVRADGRPVVLAAQVEARQLGKISKSKTGPVREVVV